MSLDDGGQGRTGAEDGRLVDQTTGFGWVVIDKADDFIGEGGAPADFPKEGDACIACAVDESALPGGGTVGAGFRK
jgi:hypothetical protein